MNSRKFLLDRSVSLEGLSVTKIRNLSVNALVDVGEESQDLLNDLGIYTIGDLANSRHFRTAALLSGVSKTGKVRPGDIDITASRNGNNDGDQQTTESSPLTVLPAIGNALAGRFAKTLHAKNLKDLALSKPYLAALELTKTEDGRDSLMASFSDQPIKESAWTREGIPNDLVPTTSGYAISKDFYVENFVDRFGKPKERTRKTLPKASDQPSGRSDEIIEDAEIVFDPMRSNNSPSVAGRPVALVTAPSFTLSPTISDIHLTSNPSNLNIGSPLLIHGMMEPMETRRVWNKFNDRAKANVDKAREAIAKSSPFAPLNIDDISGEGGFDDIAFGAQVTYRRELRPVGVNLGRLLHSLTLAPGESTNVAIVDWSRTTSTNAVEDISARESLEASSDEASDKSRKESSEMGREESGESTLDTRSNSKFDAAAGGVGIAAGPMVMGGGAVSSNSTVTGNSTMTNSSQGKQNVSAEGAERVQRSTQQAASSQRSRMASAVTEVREAGSTRSETRNVTNYNHMHAMSMHYYEVIQIYQQDVRPERVEPLIFLPTNLIDLSERHMVERYRRVLLKASRDERLSEVLSQMIDGTFMTLQGLSVLSRDHYNYSESNVLELRRWGVSGSVIDGRVELPKGYMFRGISFRSMYGENMVAQIPTKVIIETLDGSADMIVTTGMGTHIEWPIPVEMISRIRFEDAARGRDRTAYGTGINFPDPDKKVLTNECVFTMEFSKGGNRIYVPFALATKAKEFSGNTIVFRQSPLVEEAINIIAGDAQYYSQVVWRSLDQNSIITLLQARQYGGMDLSLAVDPKIVAIYGNMVGMPLSIPEGELELKDWWGDWQDRNYDPEEVQQDRVAFPTGGVHAEAVLGRANSAEFLDIRRFWDWQESPIPNFAPEISPLNPNQTGSGVAATMPGQLDSPIINLQNMPVTPGMDLSAVLAAVQNGSTFRDMSGKEQNAASVARAMQLSSENARAAGQMATGLASGAMTAAVEHVKNSKAAGTNSGFGAAYNELSKSKGSGNSDSSSSTSGDGSDGSGKSSPKESSPAPSPADESIRNRIDPGARQFDTSSMIAQADGGLPEGLVPFSGVSLGDDQQFFPTPEQAAETVYNRVYKGLLEKRNSVAAAAVSNAIFYDKAFTRTSDERAQHSAKIKADDFLGSRTGSNGSYEEGDAKKEDNLKDLIYEFAKKGNSWGDRDNYINNTAPWSASFISSCFAKSYSGEYLGNLGFVTSGAHRIYFRQGAENLHQKNLQKPFWTLPLDETAIQPGDLILKTRSHGAFLDAFRFLAKGNKSSDSTYSLADRRKVYDAIIPQMRLKKAVKLDRFKGFKPRFYYKTEKVDGKDKKSWVAAKNADQRSKGVKNIASYITLSTHSDLVIHCGPILVQSDSGALIESSSDYAITLGGNTRDQRTGQANTVGMKLYELDEDGRILREVGKDLKTTEKYDSSYAVLGKPSGPSLVDALTANASLKGEFESEQMRPLLEIKDGALIAY